MADAMTAQGIRLWIQDGAEDKGGARTLAGPVLSVGRGPGNDIALKDARVSAIHGRLVVDQGRVFFQDLGSTNGSALVREGVRRALPRSDDERTELRPGDEILLGDADRPSRLRFLSLETERAARPCSETILARRAVGAGAGAGARERLDELLSLLASLRAEEDIGALAGRVVGYLERVLGLLERAECLSWDERAGFARYFPPGDDGEHREESEAALRALCQKPEALLLEETAAGQRRFVILAPLLRDGTFAGAVRLARRELPFSASDLELAAVLAQQLSSVLSAHRLIQRLREAEERLQGERDYLRQRLMPRPALETLQGASPALAEVKRQILAAAPSRTTVLIQGETGTGKELCARAIHECSQRRGAAFAAVNCASLARGVLESELFGHMKGAFTGAHRQRKGLFEVADGGTLFLDEVGEMPLDLQPKLLRAIEEGEIWPVGAPQPRRVDIRLIAATNRDLEAEVRAGRFRRDLWYRLNVFTLRLPPLRERREDILPLARRFLEESSAEQRRPHPGLSAAAEEALLSWGWPGNVRELRNEMERASLMAPSEAPVEPCHLSPHLCPSGQAAAAGEETLDAAMARAEAEVLRQALRRHGFNRTHCARALGISRQALIAKIARFQIREE